MTEICKELTFGAAHRLHRPASLSRVAVRGMCTAGCVYTGEAG